MKQIPNDVFFRWVESELAEGRSVRFRLKGQSMFPLLRSGLDEVVLYPCTPDDFRVMDVVLFRYRGGHVLHRVIFRDGWWVYLRGDGTYVSEEECHMKDVVGVVREVVRPSGRRVRVDSWRWRLPSFLWCHLGMFRKPFLRVLHRLMR